MDEKSLHRALQRARIGNAKLLTKNKILTEALAKTEEKAKKMEAIEPFIDIKTKLRECTTGRALAKVVHTRIREFYTEEYRFTVSRNGEPLQDIGDPELYSDFPNEEYGWVKIYLKNLNSPSDSINVDLNALAQGIHDWWEKFFLIEFDDLTGLLGWSGFKIRLEREFKSSRYYKKPLSCLAIDIDFFKEINSKFNHEAGSRAILTVASMIKSLKRGSDVAARYGKMADEFGLLLPKTSIYEAADIATRLKSLINEMGLQIGQECIPLTVTIGVASNNNAAIKTGQELWNTADKALLNSKNNGARDQVAVANKESI